MSTLIDTFSNIDLTLTSKYIFSRNWFAHTYCDYNIQYAP